MAGTALSVAKGVAVQPGLFLPGRKLYFRYSSQGVEQDDALRLCPGLGRRAGGQEPSTSRSTGWFAPAVL